MSEKAFISFVTEKGQEEFDRYEKMSNNEFREYFRQEWEKLNIIAKNYRRKRK